MAEYWIGGRYWELGGEEQWKMGGIPNGDGNDMGNGGGGERTRRSIPQASTFSGDEGLREEKLGEHLKGHKREPCQGIPKAGDGAVQCQ